MAAKERIKAEAMVLAFMAVLLVLVKLAGQTTRSIEMGRLALSVAVPMEGILRRPGLGINPSIRKSFFQK
jgi:hypothetical protein